MKVNFYTFTKRINSTKQPTGTGTEYDCILKDGCSVLAPEIKLDLGLANAPAAYNYAYIPTFGRYYYVRWRWEDRLWIGQCTVDPLASFKTGIGATNTYVARSASSYNLNVVDNYYPCIGQVTELVTDANPAPDFTRSVGSGTFIVGVIGKSAGNNGGAVTYYKVTPAAMTTLCNWLLDDANYSDIDEISGALLKCIFNPMQYIVSCMWLPFNVLASGASGTIHVGWWDISVSGATQLTESNLTWTRNLAYPVPKHPQRTRGHYLDLAPYSRYIIDAAMFGCIEIDPIDVLDESSLSCEIVVDLMTGSGRLSIIGKDTLGIMEDHFAQVGVPIQIGQNVINQGAISGAVRSIGSTIGSAVAGDISGMALNGMAAIGNAAAATVPHTTSVGGNGSLAFNTNFRMLGRFLHIADEDLQNRGRPLCTARTISTLSGFVMCNDADPDISCSDEELSSIVSYMNSGFFYE